MSVRFLPEAKFLSQCRIDQFRGPGPGGQKRNKTSNSVRITHLPTGIHAVAGEFRSLEVNKLHAIRHLRMKLALEIREPIDPATFEPPDWFVSIRQNNRIAASYRHEFHAPAMGLLIDLLKVMNGSPADVATILGLSTTAVIRFLEEEPRAWEIANRIRADMGMKPLTHRR